MGFAQVDASHFVQAAVVDPSDPSTVYVIQPEVQTAVAVPVGGVGGVPMAATAVPVATAVGGAATTTPGGGAFIPTATVVSR
eukprot:COSAG01_NODE_352_length_18424_cov_29.195034_14_plen_82_part_00